MSRNTVAVAAIILGLVSACGGGGGGSAPAAGGSTTGTGSGTGGAGTGGGSPSTQVPLIPPGEPVLIFRSAFRLGDPFDTVNEAINVVVPSTGERTRIFTNTSTSGARSNVGVRTFGDRVLIRRNDSGGSGDADWIDVDVAAMVEKTAGDIAGQVPALARLSTLQGTALPNCVAVVGTTLYWQTPSNGLRSAELGMPGVLAGTELLAAGDPNGCFGANVSATGQPGPAAPVGGLDVSAGTGLVGLRYDADLGTIDVFERDPQTGQPAFVAGVTALDHAFYDRAYSLAVSDGIVYWTRIHGGNREIEIWGWDLVGQPQLIATTQATLVSAAVVFQLDVTDGYFALMAGPAFATTNVVLLFDANAATWTEIDLFDFVPPVGGFVPPSFSELQIVYR